MKQQEMLDLILDKVTSMDNDLKDVLNSIKEINEEVKDFKNEINDIGKRIANMQYKMSEVKYIQDKISKVKGIQLQMKVNADDETDTLCEIETSQPCMDQKIVNVLEEINNTASNVCNGIANLKVKLIEDEIRKCHKE